jgi:hypothetical protein
MDEKLGCFAACDMVVENLSGKQKTLINFTALPATFSNVEKGIYRKCW